MPVDDVQIPNILWILFAILMGLMALTVGKETSESKCKLKHNVPTYYIDDGDIRENHYCKELKED